MGQAGQVLYYLAFAVHAEETCQQKEPKCRKCATARLCDFHRRPKAAVKRLSHRTARVTTGAAPSARRVKSSRPAPVRTQKKRIKK